ncbi:conserved hypothetical protein [Uncinocarpus reesii 1704]|uniref:DNA repair metallo-beta-lactamase domain-containing protein n=1 Tax=Uncinocarpus reesii (strain UAMH 1704) TaxID=336963 RepID=C4JVM4_UNCRE|nr:uncharacterized protein UREG_06616 [Uncinocarpus reesii 1704]EEP81751.1 conserved hypothetical protein [Uncinocarpus reesii 1704]
MNVSSGLSNLAEPWWVQSLIRNPVLIPYTLGNRRLNRIYLDTTFATKSDIYATFPSKAEGIRELLQKVKAYPEDEAPYLCGFTLGNSRVSGCLTDQTNTPSVKVHSCEPGVVCSTIESGPSVYITPIITRTKEGCDVLELGAGGGMGDLRQSHDLQLPDKFAVERFADLCSEYIEDPSTRKAIIDAVSKAYETQSKSLSLDSYGFKEQDEMTLKSLVAMLSQGSKSDILPTLTPNKISSLPNTIVRFPYSRHSSYEELCGLVEAFRPADVYPCTVDADTWTETVSMENLFGHLCSGAVFSHDNEMKSMIEQDDFRPRKRPRLDSNASSTAGSTQRSNIETGTSQELVVPERIEYPVIHISSDSEQQQSQQENERPLGTRQITTVDTELSFSFPSQVTSNLSNSQPDESSSSPDIKIQAIKQALKAKALNNELDFYFESSFADSQSQPRSSSQLDNLNTQPSVSSIAERGDSQSALDIDANIQLEAELENAEYEYASSSPLSLSPSAFGSQESIQIPLDDDDDDVTLSPQRCEGRVVSALKRTHSRMAAYRAAKDDTWALFHSLVSAGNNHTVEDEEL